MAGRNWTSSWKKKGYLEDIVYTESEHGVDYVDNVGIKLNSSRMLIARRQNILACTLPFQSTNSLGLRERMSIHSIVFRVQQ